jgi:hypothetical protein
LKGVPTLKAAFAAGIQDSKPQQTQKEVSLKPKTRGKVCTGQFWVQEYCSLSRELWHLALQTEFQEDCQKKYSYHLFVSHSYATFPFEP